MFRKKKRNHSRRGRRTAMSTESSYTSLLAEVLKSENFEDELYKVALGVVVNRIESQTSDISENDLLNYVQQLFDVSREQHKIAIEEVRQNTFSDECVLKVFVEKAEHLAPKDVDGSSDPYCLLGVVHNSQYTSLRQDKFEVKQTKVINSNLNPEWKQSMQFNVLRDRISRDYFQLQVWDYDGTNDKTKKVKGVKGVKRYMQEVAQSVTNKSDDKDDFMGFTSIPITSIPAEGLERWFKLRTSHTLQNVSGRIKLRLSVNSIKKSPGGVKENTYADDVIYAGLLRKIVLKAYNEYSFQSEGSTVDYWDGKLPLAGQVLIRELDEQHTIPRLSAAIARWEVYAALHLQRSPGMDITFMETLLGDLESNSKHANRYIGSMKFTVEMVCESMKAFLQQECNKIAQHREVFSAKKNNYVIQLGSLLLIFKKLSTMGIYNLLRTMDSSLIADVKMYVVEALKKGTGFYYITLYESLLDESIDEDNANGKKEEEAPIGGAEVLVLVKLVEALHRDLMFGKAVYHNVFLKLLDIDYVALVASVIEQHLGRDTKKTMGNVNNELNNIQETFQPENRSALLFRFYLAMRDLAEVTKPKPGLKSVEDSPLRRLIAKRNTSEDPPITLQQYHEWFRPTVLRWLHLSRGRTRNLLKKAVELDSVKRVDDIVKHSSSAVDTIACLTGVVTFWGNLQWPDPVDAYTIALRLTDDIASAIESYADLVHKKLREVGFFDDEGQFDVTEELCIALNNLQYVKSFLEEVPQKMGFGKLADMVDKHPEGPSKERVLSTFTSLLGSADIGMNKKIQSITAVVGSKMKPDIRRYLYQFAQQVTDGESDVGYHKNQDQSVRSILEARADGAIEPLMKYLNSNIIALNEWLCEPNFRRILEVLWEVSLQSLRKIALVEFVEQRPGFFYQSRYVFNHHLAEFFHAEGAGISVQKIKNSTDSRVLNSELKMRCATTRDLIKLFYLQMYEEQQNQESNPTFGFLNVYAWYDLANEEVHVDVISASKLRPLDINGLSDPFVQLRLAPVMLFRDQRSHQTLVEKKTLNPVWKGESFVFDVDQSLVPQEGNVIIFTVLDHDVISSNDLEGEAVLPLNMLDGAPGSEGKKSRTFRLTLSQPQKMSKTPVLKPKITDENANGVNVISNGIKKVEFSNITLSESDLDYESSYVISPLYLLHGRVGFDKDADEFVRWRRKLQKAKESGYCQN